MPLCKTFLQFRERVLLGQKILLAVNALVRERPFIADQIEREVPEKRCR